MNQRGSRGQGSNDRFTVQSKGPGGLRDAAKAVWNSTSPPTHPPVGSNPLHLYSLRMGLSDGLYPLLVLITLRKYIENRAICLGMTGDKMLPSAV